MLARLRYRCSADVVIAVAAAIAAFVLGFAAIDDLPVPGRVLSGGIFILVLTLPLGLVLVILLQIAEMLIDAWRFRPHNPRRGRLET